MNTNQSRIDEESFQRTEEEIRQYSLMEKWLYFLKLAAHVDAKQLANSLPEPQFNEAIGVLNMMPQTPADRQAYQAEARTKFLSDKDTRLLRAWLGGS